MLLDGFEMIKIIDLSFGGLTAADQELQKLVGVA